MPEPKEEDILTKTTGSSWSLEDTEPPWRKCIPEKAPDSQELESQAAAGCCTCCALEPGIQQDQQEISTTEPPLQSHLSTFPMGIRRLDLKPPNLCIRLRPRSRCPLQSLHTNFIVSASRGKKEVWLRPTVPLN